MGKMNIFTVKATAKQVSRRRIMLKVAYVVGGISTFILLLFYGMAAFARGVGNFTVNVPNDGDGACIALCENPEFNESTTKLFAEPLEEIDNIAERSIPSDVDSGEYYGSHNGKYYIAYTFYLKNVCDETISYIMSIDIEKNELGVDEAVRVKVYHNGEPTTYAKYKKDSLEPEPNTTPFYSSKQVMYTEVSNFEQGGIEKFTIVIWLEGDDPECIDNIRGGKIKFSVNFKTIE